MPIAKRVKQIYDHFNSEAQVFDSNIEKSVPCYQQMIKVIMEMIPFSQNDNLTIMDIGTGTGNIACNIMQFFPKARLICLDLVPNMLKIAADKLRSFPQVEYLLADIGEYIFDRHYDAIVSSLTLHHLATDRAKHAFHKKAFGALKKSGIFINADIVISQNNKAQAVNLARWKEYLLHSSSPEFVADRYKKYLAEDRPTTVTNELRSLQKAGFRQIEVFWKYYNFAVYGGIK